VPISEIISPFTETEAFFTRWRTIFRARFLEGLAAPVAGLYLVPVAYALFGRVPAEEDYAAVALVGEVQEARIEVFEEDAEFADTLYGEVEAVRLDAVFGACPPAAVGGGGLEDRLQVRGFLAHGLAVDGEIV
jgi:hypothetical protein